MTGVENALEAVAALVCRTESGCERTEVCRGIHIKLGLKGEFSLLNDTLIPVFTKQTSHSLLEPLIKIITA